MVAFAASPGEEKIDDGEAAGVDGDACGKGVAEVVEGDVVAVHAYLGFVDGEEKARGEFAQRVLEGFAQEEKVGCAEAVVGVAGEDGLAIEVGAADGGIEVEGDHASGVGDGAGHEEADGDGTFEVLSK